VVYLNTTTHRASEIVCEAAAALAATSIVFKTDDPSYASTCLLHSKQLYSMGKTYPVSAFIPVR
jgi:endoglucanase